MSLSWTPKLQCGRGTIYCSPACGYGCTKDAYDQATRKAKALAKRMGAGWKPKVWENLGWHYSAIKGDAVVRENVGSNSTIASYTVYFNAEKQFVVDGLTPYAALAKAINDAKKHVKRLQGQIRLME